MTASLAQVLAAIEQFPQGVTSAQLATILNATSYNVSTCASRLWCRGKIIRKPVASPNRAVYAWIPKPAPSSPIRINNG